MSAVSSLGLLGLFLITATSSPMAVSPITLSAVTISSGVDIFGWIRPLMLVIRRVGVLYVVDVPLKCISDLGLVIPFLFVWVGFWLVTLRLLLGIAMLAWSTFAFIVLVLHLSTVVWLVAVSPERWLLIHVGVLSSFDLVCCQLF
jgi:hypothetical protein